MASNSSTPSKGISYLQHFPKYFLVPYGETKELTSEVFNKRLSSTNCKMFLKPRTFLSEMAETVIKNDGVLNEPWFNSQIGEKIQKRNAHLKDVLQKFNQKEGAQAVTSSDVESLVKELKNDKLDSIYAQLYDMGHKLFLMGIYYQVSRHLVQNPEMFAKHVNLISRNDADFKKSPDEETMLEMLKSELVTDKVAKPQRVVKRNLNAALESTDEEDEATAPPQPKKKKI